MPETTTKVAQILDAVSTLTVLELAELVKAFEEKFDVKAAAPMMMGAMPAAAAAPAEEKTEFDAVLTEVGANKIQVIKVVREITGLGLKEAKDLVEAAPKAIKEAVPKKDAEEIAKKIADVGGTVTIK